MDFLRMIYELAKLPKPQMSIRFKNLRSYADSFTEYNNSEEKDDKF